MGSPAFSPDGRWIAFYSDQSETIKKIAITGGAAVTLCAVPRWPFGISWVQSRILFGQAAPDLAHGIMEISPDGGKPRRVIALEDGEVGSAPQLLPDGETVLFTLLEGEPYDRWDKAQSSPSR